MQFNMSGSQSPQNYLEPLVQIRIKTEPETERREYKEDQHLPDCDYRHENNLSNPPPNDSLSQPDEGSPNNYADNSTAESNYASTKTARANRPKAKKYRCSICRQGCRDERSFFGHLKSHYVPKRGEQYQCSVCKISFRAQVDYFLHLRQHYEPSLMSNMGNAITGKGTFINDVTQLGDRGSHFCITINEGPI